MEHRVKPIWLIGSHESAMVNFRMTLVGSLARQGHRVHLLVWGKPGSQAPSLRAQMDKLDGCVSYLGSKGANLSPMGDLAALLRLVWLALRDRPRAALCFAAKPIGLGMLALGLLRVPNRVALMEGKGSGIASGGLVARLNLWLYRCAFRLASQIVVLNDFDQAWVADQGHAPRTKIKRLDGIGVELDHFVPTPLDHSAPPQAVYVGRMAHSKGLRTLLDSFVQVKAQIPLAQLALYGPMAESQQDRLDPSTLKGQGIQYNGEVPRAQVPEVLAGAWVVIVPSIKPEGLPLIVQEGFACARPAIVSDVEGCRDAISSSDVGWIVKAGDASSLSQALLSALSSPAQTAKMGMVARRMAESRFDRVKGDQILAKWLLNAQTPQTPQA